MHITPSEPTTPFKEIVIFYVQILAHNAPSILLAGICKQRVF
jgi:hypothetical protein